MKISHRGGPKITFSYPFVHLYKSYNSSKVPAMPCHESSLSLLLTRPAGWTLQRGDLMLIEAK